MLFNTFTATGCKTDIHFDPERLQELPCGLHRAPLNKAHKLLPDFAELIASCPVPPIDWENWSIDIKAHMLMKGQYPCIPNWHCDNVPRNDEGKVDYKLVTEDAPKMYLWLSGNPTTQFLREPVNLVTPSNHGRLNEILLDIREGRDGLQAPEQEWISMDQATPHRGMPSQESTWRVFARITHNSIAPDRPVVSHIRRHAQVYLPYDFFW